MSSFGIFPKCASATFKRPIFQGQMTRRDSRLPIRRSALPAAKPKRPLAFTANARPFVLRLLAYCVQSNHFHRLLAVPRRPAVRIIRRRGHFPSCIRPSPMRAHSWSAPN